MKNTKEEEKKQTAMSRGEASKSHQAMGRHQPAAAAQARAPGAPAPPPSAPPLPPGLAEDGEFVDVELGDQERRRPSTAAPRPETRPSGQQRGSHDGDLCCNVLIFMLVLLGAAVVLGIWFLAIIGLHSLVDKECC